MTIDEAIAHCKEKSNCSECGKEHEQLAVWLAELKRYKNLKEQGRLIEMPCEDESKKKYRWHDLRKNPDDLPKNDSDLLAVRECMGLIRQTPVNFVNSTWFDCLFNEIATDIIAWREIEPFEER